MRRFRKLLLGSIALAAMIPTVSYAKSTSSSDTEALKVQLQAALERVEMLERRLGTLEQLTIPAHAVTLSDAAQAEMRGRGLGAQASSSAPAAPAPASVASSSDTRQAAGADPERKAPAPTVAVEDVASQQQGNYGKRLSFEFGTTYSRFSKAQLNLSGFLALDSIFLGNISIDETNADVVTTDATLRWGATDSLSFDVNVPYLWRRSNFQSGGAGGNARALAEQDIGSHGLGDISFGASYRMMPETYRRPDIVISARVKTPSGRHPFGIKLIEVANSTGNLLVPGKLSTGTGTWGLSAGMSILKTIDPMVVFGSVSYFHNFAQDFADVSEVAAIDPVTRLEVPQPGRAKFGDAFQFGAGIAFALNEKSSLSTSFTQRIVARSRLQQPGLANERIVGSQANIGTLNLGATFSVDERLSIIANIGTGLTRDAPDMTLALRVPYRF